MEKRFININNNLAHGKEILCNLNLLESHFIRNIDNEKTTDTDNDSGSPGAWPFLQCTG